MIRLRDLSPALFASIPAGRFPLYVNRSARGAVDLRREPFLYCIRVGSGLYTAESDAQDVLADIDVALAVRSLPKMRRA